MSDIGDKNVKRETSLVTCLLSSFVRFSFSENCATDANNRRAFGNRGFKVVGHTHGKMLPRALRKARAEFVAQSAQRAKVRTCVVGLRDNWRNRHQPLRVEMWQRKNRAHRVEKLLARFGRKAGL